MSTDTPQIGNAQDAALIKFEFKPGDTVVHRLRHDGHDEHVGIVLEGRAFMRPSGCDIDYLVRWLSPTGCPDNSAIWHSRFELRAKE